MNTFALNPLSIGKQCNSDADIKEVLATLMEGLDFVWPAVQAKRIKLLYDSSIEQKELVAGETILSSISRMKTFSDDGPDLIRKWYLYTKSHAEDVTDHGIEITLECEKKSFPATVGMVSTSYIDEANNWISLGAWPVGAAEKYVITTKIKSIPKTNVSTEAGIRSLVANYAPSEKHGPQPYWDRQRQVHVSPMPLDVDAAQRVILAGIAHNQDIYSRHAQTGDLYRFVQTNGNVYHGFKVEEKDVPNACLKQL